MTVSLTDLVIDLLEDHPGSDVDDLMPELPKYSREQIKQTLQNLSFTHRAKCVRQGVKGFQKGAKPGRYWPIEQDLERRAEPFVIPVVSSVWDLGRLA